MNKSLPLFFFFFMILNISNSSAATLLPKDSSLIEFYGRWLIENNQARTSAPGASVQFSFEGTSIYAEIEGESYWVIEIDGHEHSSILTGVKQKYALAENLPTGKHQVTLSKKSETPTTEITLFSLSTNKEGVFTKPRRRPNRRIEFIGDSFTVGYGNEAKNAMDGDVFEKTNATKSFAYLLGKSLLADIQINAFSGRGLVQNYANHTPEWSALKLYEYTIPGIAEKQPNAPLWDYNSWHPHVIVIFLGINDYQGDFSHTKPAVFDSVYSAFLDQLRSKHPGVKFLLLSTKVWPGDDLTPRIEAIVQAQKRKGFKDIECHLMTSENTALDGHPSEYSHQNMANQIRPIIARLGKWLQR